MKKRSSMNMEGVGISLSMIKQRAVSKGFAKLAKSIERLEVQVKARTFKHHENRATKRRVL
jgi:hypothetical protein